MIELDIAGIASLLLAYVKRLHVGTGEDVVEVRVRIIEPNRGALHDRQHVGKELLVALVHLYRAAGRVVRAGNILDADDRLGNALAAALDQADNFGAATIPGDVGATGCGYAHERGYDERNKLRIHG